MEKKFKIWDKKHKRWFHGHNDPSRPESTEAISLFGETILFGSMMLDQNTDKQISLERLNDLVAIQYTGLKDKNGKEIYEAYIIRVTIGRKYNDYEVYYSDVNAGYWIKNIDSDVEGVVKPVNSLAYLSVNKMNYEIKGNIYESPELLKNNQ